MAHLEYDLQLGIVWSEDGEEEGEEAHVPVGVHVAQLGVGHGVPNLILKKNIYISISLFQCCGSRSSRIRTLLVGSKSGRLGPDPDFGLN
jgi:hypothetical protein